jgi:hypothetical protein
MTHEVLDILLGNTALTPYLGEVSIRFHPQQSAQIMPPIDAGISGLAFEAGPVAFPESMQSLPKLTDRFQRNAPGAPRLFFSSLHSCPKNQCDSIFTVIVECDIGKLSSELKKAICRMDWH